MIVQKHTVIVSLYYSDSLTGSLNMSVRKMMMHNDLSI